MKSDRDNRKTPSDIRVMMFSAAVSEWQEEEDGGDDDQWPVGRTPYNTSFVITHYRHT